MFHGNNLLFTGGLASAYLPQYILTLNSFPKVYVLLLSEFLQKNRNDNIDISNQIDQDKQQYDDQ